MRRLSTSSSLVALLPYLPSPSLTPRDVTSTVLLFTIFIQKKISVYTLPRAFSGNYFKVRRVINRRITYSRAISIYYRVYLDIEWSRGIISVYCSKTTSQPNYKIIYITCYNKSWSIFSLHHSEHAFNVDDILISISSIARVYYSLR